MRILVSGGSGLVGSELINTLNYDGHQVVQLVRRNPDPEASAAEHSWDPEQGTLNTTPLGRIDAAIHLGGVPIFGKRWSSSRKLLIRESRVRSTRLISQSLAALPQPPRVLIVASAVGYYGDRGEEPLTEESPPAEGFLAETAVKWEKATDVARDAGIRVVNARFGLIISRRGGLVGKLRVPFQSALGGKMGNGRQWWPWISLVDVVNALSYLIGKESIFGPVNLTAPTPIRNEDFTRLMAKAVSRPAWFNIPKPVIKLVLGQMGEEMTLYSQRVYPEKLRASGFVWVYEDLAENLHYELVSSRADRWGPKRPG
ncbi:MAG: TIGR01777 family oxidoreductase [Chloroflexi bacterium]|nr:TIGR01777 family oxidoreductase [Chloroflexota bacterium]